MDSKPNDVALRDEYFKQLAVLPADLEVAPEEVRIEMEPVAEAAPPVGPSRRERPLRDYVRDLQQEFEDQQDQGRVG